MATGYVDRDGNYYVGEKQRGSVEVPLRPTPDHTWDGSKWVITLETAKRLKLDEIRTAWREETEQGFLSSGLGTPHRYPGNIEDQLNLVGATEKGLNVHFTCTEEATGIKARKLHLVTQMRTVFLDGVAWKESQIGKLRTKENEVINATSVASVNAIVW